jgi:hypothetical protein
VPTSTDIIIFCFLLFFLLDGWRKSLFKSAIGPFVFLICSIFGIIYFDLTQNAVKAIFYTGLATTIITGIIFVLFSVGKRSVDPTYRNYSPIFNRILGSIINLAWQGMVLFVILFIVVSAPIYVYGFQKVQNNIRSSLSYSFIGASLSQIPMLQRIVTAFSVFQNAHQMQRLSSTEEFRQFFLNEKIQALLRDEAFMESVEKKDFAKIMGNTKIMEIFSDDELMSTFNRLAKRIYSMDFPELPEETGGKTSGQEQ